MFLHSLINLLSYILISSDSDCLSCLIHTVCVDRLNEDARKLIAELGSSSVKSLGFRDNWVFVGGKGASVQNNFEKVTTIMYWRIYIYMNFFNTTQTLLGSAFKFQIFSKLFLYSLFTYILLIIFIVNILFICTFSYLVLQQLHNSFLQDKKVLSYL